MNPEVNPHFNRAHLMHQLEITRVWDVLIIGGGATGLGIAVDAAARGYSTLLLEASDFAKGTSSRSTKLVHGGVRYLAQGNIPLVYSALQERGILLKNAPHVVHKRAFIIPCFDWSDCLKYLVGLKLYDALSGKWSFGKSKWLSKAAVMAQLPGIKEGGLKGGVLYFDGQFDDARLAINLAQTAIEHGAVVLNYIKVVDLQKNDGQLTGVIAKTSDAGKEYKLQAKTVINATGVFAEAIHQLDQPQSKPLLKQSQGVHLVFDRSLFPATSALMIPKTRDGRVLFAIPWNNRIVVGTTDTPVSSVTPEPLAQHAEVTFILETLNQFVETPVIEMQIQAVFAGLRPLALPQKEVVSTKELSRDHKIVISDSGLITIIGGKWTTYRKMAADVLDTAIKKGKLQSKTCTTKNHSIHGSTSEQALDHLAVYGSDGMSISKSWTTNPQLKERIHPAYPFTDGEVVWAVQQELALTVEDVLARRVRLLFLDAAAAMEAAPRVAHLMCALLQQSEQWEQEQVRLFNLVASNYKYQPTDSSSKIKETLPIN